MDSKEAADLLKMTQSQATVYTTNDQLEMVILPRAVYLSLCAWLKAESLNDEPKGQNG